MARQKRNLRSSSPSDQNHFLSPFGIALKRLSHTARDSISWIDDGWAIKCFAEDHPQAIQVSWKQMISPSSGRPNLPEWSEFEGVFSY